MNKQTILIYDFSILFKILFEIKQNLNFEILEVKNDKDFSNLDKNKLGNYVIIAKNQKDNFFSENCIVFEKLPIKRIISPFSVMLNPSEMISVPSDINFELLLLTAV